MRNFVARPVAVVACLLLLVMGRAVNASDAVGWITLLDEETDQIVLDSGMTFALSDEINLSSLADGKRVRVTFETIGGIPTVTGIILLALQTNQAESPSLDAPLPLCENRASVPERSHGSEQTNLYC